MKKLKKILASRSLLVILLITAFIHVLSNSLITRESIYDVNQNEFYGTIKNFKIKDDKITIELGSKEDLICNYYIDNTIVNYRKEFPLGGKVKIKGTLKEPKNNTVPNTFNYKKYLYNKGIFYTCNVDNIEVISNKINVLYRIKNWMINRLVKYKYSDYMLTLIMGDKSLMDEEVYDGYKRNGVVHLFAISGMHIGLFSLIVMWILKKLKLKENFRYIIAITVLFFYAFITGFSSSVLRATLLFTIISLNKILKLEISSMRSLIYTGIILLLSNYRIVCDVGFVFSFTTSFGLIYEKEFLSKHKVLGTSLVAFLYSLPITIYNFFKVNFLSVVFNLIFVPLVSSVVYPLSLVSFIFKPCEAILGMSIKLLETLNDFCSSISFSYLVIPKLPLILIAIYYIVLIMFFKKKPSHITILLIVSILLCKSIPYLDRNNYVTFIDVGQGDSTLLISNHAREVILIDTGGITSFSKREPYRVTDNTMTYLNSLGLDKIDTLILTHGDYDHMGDAAYLIDNFKIGEVIFNCGTYNDLESELIQVLKEKGITYASCIEELNFGKEKLTFLNTKRFDDENNDSNVIYTELNNYKFLFMGDAGKIREKNILEKYNLNNIDFLKVGHHGSDTSSDKEFINYIKPKYSIISVGKNNRYGHPKESVLRILSNSKIYRTDLDGSIEIELNKNEYKIRTFSP